MVGSNKSQKLLCLFLLFFFIALSQNKKGIDFDCPPEIYSKVDEAPQFPGGLDSLFIFISNNIKFPEIYAESCIQGRVFVEFVINCNGNIENIKVIRGVDPPLDEEAIRVVRLLPRWIPGKINGRSVNVKYIVPVTFQLH